jgi:hypothetical protein
MFTRVPKRCVPRESAAAGRFSTVYARRSYDHRVRTGRHLQAVVHIRRTVQA